MSKGSNPRPVDATKYRENWDRIFGRVDAMDGTVMARGRRIVTEPDCGCIEWQHISMTDGSVTARGRAHGDSCQKVPPVIDEHGHQDLT